jgi:antitoxin component YwqK of YwqJK toxin-antitoxin module
MKKLIFLCFFIIVAGASAQQVAYVTDTKFVGTSIAGTDTIHYFKSDPYEGDWIVYYDSTQKQIAFTKKYYTRQRYDYKSWYSNGQPKNFLINNDSLPVYQPHERTSWSCNGQKQTESRVTRDSTISRSWWKNGQLSIETRTWGGKPWDHKAGVRKWWHPSGILYRTDSFFVDSTISRYYHDSGQLSTITIYLRDTAGPFGLSCHYMHSFHPNGREQSTVLHPHLGRQPITYFYATGIRKAECEWMEGNIGLYKEWHENGKLKAEGNYSIGIKKFSHVKSINYYSTKTGHWIYYNEAGWKEKEEWRELDGSLTFKEYDASGKVINEGSSQEEIPAGVVFPEEYQH